jgi:hypothetical protein
MIIEVDVASPTLNRTGLFLWLRRHPAPPAPPAQPATR